MKRIGVLCSGGDCQGMNISIKTIVNMCAISGIEVFGFKYGYRGIVENIYEKLNNEKVENIADQGGCYLKVSRYEAFRKGSVIDKAVQNIKANKLDGIIILGGDGSFRGSLELVKRGINIVCIPATIDNDLFYSEKSLGFDTAVNNAVSAIDNMRQSIESNDRSLIVEVMGRTCGNIALSVAIAVSANVLAVNETGATLNKLVKDIEKNIEQGEKVPLVIVNEKVAFSIEDVKLSVEKKLGLECRTAILGYIQRGGAPSVSDRILAVRFSINALELLKEKIGGVAVGLKDREIFVMNIKDALNVPNNFDMSLYHSLRQLHGL